MGLLDDLFEGPRLFFSLAEALVPGTAPPVESVRALRASLQRLAGSVDGADLRPLFTLLDELERSAGAPPSDQRVRDLEREMARLREELRRAQERAAQPRPAPAAPPQARPAPPAAPGAAPAPPQQKPADPPKPDRFELIEID